MRRLTRAQVEFLGTSRGGASMNGPKSAVSQNTGFFNRHNSFPANLKSARRDCYDSLRLLDPRKERRMDPQGDSLAFPPLAGAAVSEDRLASHVALVLCGEPTDLLRH